MDARAWYRTSAPPLVTYVQRWGWEGSGSLIPELGATLPHAGPFNILHTSMSVHHVRAHFVADFTVLCGSAEAKRR